MNYKKFFELDSITVANKEIYPIVLLKLINVKDTFFNIDYEVVMFKIIENKKIYYKNVILSQKDFEYVKNFF
ncbi:MAG: hypothetical protein IJI98_06855 [Methanosphaera sp.]|uniref:hypothetical protein n=1 Tax=Methanosphaera sp. ISO3-F5 TaxID=1452353 RepID=UPI002B260741|nr:hypothetical protein [Methanosphaera sp. ISO3-F5]MBR0472403.1 hypothetical protein [Methanosphaera sp.]WQH63213.1 hypothetical protein PXD04_05720 [Methanosphaera sp. ISO3-F5]